MQYQHAGSRSGMPPFARGGGAYSRGQKQFYPPPPPPLPAAALPLPPQNKYEVLMEAGRLAAGYLVAKGVLPPGSLQQRGGTAVAGGWGQLPPPPPPPPPLPLSVTQEAPAYYGGRNGRRQVDDERGIRNARSWRNHGGDYSSSNSSNYNGRGKGNSGLTISIQIGQRVGGGTGGILISRVMMMRMTMGLLGSKGSAEAVVGLTRLVVACRGWLGRGHH